MMKIEKNQVLFCFATALLAIHIILDLFCGGVFIAYPLSNENFDFDASLVLLAQKEITPAPKNTSDIFSNASKTSKILKIQ